ncbi:MAG: hypothetical protein KatS3mg104_0371 [Phycisphaerae bacterium]|nr:MAG: hypothetical protein KatS3mg104_0371 [Phycisphaerae bacterium]
MIWRLVDIFSSRLSVRESEARRERIRQQILGTSRSIQIPNFVYFNDQDLWTLYQHYDRLFFDQQLSNAVADQGGERVGVEVQWSTSFQRGSDATNLLSEQTPISIRDRDFTKYSSAKLLHPG